jgi:hypothetical protein
MLVMDVSDLRKRILRALDDARKDASERRRVTDAAAEAYEGFLSTVAVPLVRQAVTVLRAEGQAFVANTPAGGVRLASERTPETFLEFELSRNGARAEVIGRVSVSRGHAGVVVDERPIAPGKPIADLGDEDVTAFLVAEIPKLVLRP